MADGEEERRIAAYHKYPSDHTAAQALGIGDSTFRMWRLKRKLPAKRPQGRHVDPYLDWSEEERRLRIYIEAVDDKEASIIAGLTLQGWKKWRQSRMLLEKFDPPHREAS